MLFNNKFSKFGRGNNLSAIMLSDAKIEVFYYNKGVLKKTINIEEENLSLTTSNQTFPYNEVIPVSENFLVTRIDKSIGIIANE